MSSVLHVTECYSAGVQHVINSLVAATPQHRHHLLFAEAAPGAFDVGVAWSSVTELPAGILRRVASVGRVVRAERPDTVHAHSSWAGVYARARRLPVPVVYQPHCFAFEAEGRPRWVRAVFRVVERGLAPRARAIVAVSTREQRLASELDDRVEVRLIRNVATVSPFASTPAPRRVTPTVVMVGRLCEQKDPEAFVRLAAAVRAVLPDVVFRWIGDGDERWRRTLAAGRVEVTGWLSSQDVQRELEAATVYHHCARYEGFPVGVLDAAAVGLPLVLPAIPAFDELGIPLHRTCDSLAAEIVRLCSDPIAREEAATRSRALYEELTTPTMAEAAHALYEELASPTTRTAGLSEAGGRLP